MAWLRGVGRPAAPRCARTESCNVAESLGPDEAIFTVYPPAWHPGLEETRMVL